MSDWWAAALGVGLALFFISVVLPVFIGLMFRLEDKGFNPIEWFFIWEEWLIRKVAGD